MVPNNGAEGELMVWRSIFISARYPRTIFSIREINMSNDFDLNRVPFPSLPPSLELICLMGEVAECADRSEGGEGGVCYLSRF